MLIKRNWFSRALAAACLLLLPTTAQADSIEEVDRYNWFDPIIDIQRIIADRFVAEPDFEELQLAAIDGMIEALGDQYTVFVPAESIEEFDKELRGRYVGIGASVRIEDGWMTIVSPLDDSPAYRAGILAGDRVIAVDGASTMDLSLDDGIELLTGEPGTKVVVTVERGVERVEIPIIRAEIQTRSVFGFGRDREDQWQFMLDPDNGIGYVRVSQFTGGTIPELEAALNDLIDDGMQGLVFDLRFNPGGSLSAAVQMADLFLSQGMIVSTRGRSFDEESVFATAEGTLPDFPMVILLNRRSASASEVVSSALRDNGRAIVLGERSFGKGSVQSVLPLQSGRGQLKITEQRYYGPSGKVIHREDESTEWGVDPTDGYYVPMTDQEYNDMLRERQRREVIGNGDDDDDANEQPHGAEWILDTLKDKQLASAVRALNSRIASGDWDPAESIDDSDESLELAELRRMQTARERLLREMRRVNRRIEALATTVNEDEVEPEPMFPEETELDGGVVKVYAADGSLAGELRITGEGLQRWLMDAPVEKIDDASNE